MSAPVIAISCYFIPKMPMWKNGAHALPQEYVHSILAVGGLPVLVPPGIEEPKNLLDRVDGLILAGGGDVAPDRYRGELHPKIEYVDPPRDAGEIALFDATRSLGLPVLAICRGLQLVNVALGGTLRTHLPGDPHRAPGGQGPKSHDVRLDPESRLASILGTHVRSVASLHHQAVDLLAEGLEAVGWADDGVIEAVEAPNLLAVQWHPELTAAEDEVQRRLFNAFVRTAAGRTPPTRNTSEEMGT